ncbi:hypothetical protein QBC43DRAFT_354590 [Cladorrhinum sp. PSN259]|nr:hypothetical protein QBC43DRAFT_354590 [Cladorrhinum sp. PSN259]
MSWHKKGNEAVPSKLRPVDSFNTQAPRGPVTRAPRSRSICFREAEDILQDWRSSRFRKRSISTSNASDLGLPQGDAYYSSESSRQSSNSAESTDSGENPLIANNSKNRKYLLNLSDSVRASIKSNKTLGPDTEKLSAFLDAALEQEKRKINPLTFETIQFARLDRLVTEIRYLKNANPVQAVKEQADKADLLQQFWVARFKSRCWDIDNLRKAHLEKGGRLQGICLSKADWVVKNSHKSKKADEFYVGQWWLNIACAHRDRIVNSDKNMATITPHKGCTIPLLGGREEVIHVNKTIYTLYSRPKSPLTWQLLFQVNKNVRILRGDQLRSALAPKAGVRYDGVWKLTNLSPAKLYMDAFNGYDPKRDIYETRFQLERINEQTSMGEVLKVPTPSQMDDWALYRKIEEDKIKQTKGVVEAWGRSKREEQEDLEREIYRSNEKARIEFDTEKRESPKNKISYAEELITAQPRERMRASEGEKLLEVLVPENANGENPNVAEDGTEGNGKKPVLVEDATEENGKKPEVAEDATEENGN